MIFFLFFFIRTRPTRQPLFHPRPVRMQTNRGIIHGSNSSNYPRHDLPRLERVCLTPLICRQGSYRCQDLGGGVRSDRGALSSLFAPHSSPGLIPTFPIVRWPLSRASIGDNVNQVASKGREKEKFYAGRCRSSVRR